MPAPVRSPRPLSPAWLVPAVVGIGYLVWDLLQWVVAWRGAGDYAAARASFQQHVPFATPMGESLAAIGAGVLGLVGALALTRSSRRGLRRAGMVLVAVGCPLLFWQLWVLM